MALWFSCNRVIVRELCRSSRTYAADFRIRNGLLQTGYSSGWALACSITLMGKLEKQALLCRWLGSQDRLGKTSMMGNLWNLNVLQDWRASFLSLLCAYSQQKKQYLWKGMPIIDKGRHMKVGYGRDEQPSVMQQKNVVSSAFQAQFEVNIILKWLFRIFQKNYKLWLGCNVLGKNNSWEC